MLGGCNCGEIRYIISCVPLTTYVCHCHLCQKRSGSAFSMSIVLSIDGFQLTQGTPMRPERPLSNDSRNTSYLCPLCYSHIYTRRKGCSTINVRAGTLDDTSQIRPVAQFWTASAQPWALIKDRILSYVEQPTDYEPLFAAWKAASSGDWGWFARKS
jgi:hypothetical protein